ncbi:uncharacterized protein LOC143127144 [Alosa pseudoharengus]|uniref:uncharacterized protein LOC143127144 n=1 Tax=Alosa pseudoharengus TaxID=34774 RepID=UPI003F89CC41
METTGSEGESPWRPRSADDACPALGQGADSELGQRAASVTDMQEGGACLATPLVEEVVMETQCGQSSLEEEPSLNLGEGSSLETPECQEEAVPELLGGGAYDVNTPSGGGSLSEETVMEGGATDKDTPIEGGATDINTPMVGGVKDMDTPCKGGVNAVGTPTEGGARDMDTLVEGGVRYMGTPSGGGANTMDTPNEGGVNTIDTPTGGGAKDMDTC